VREGWHVPRDLSLASADVSPIATEGTPRITAAGSNPEKLGEAAARLGDGDGIAVDAQQPTVSDQILQDCLCVSAPPKRGVQIDAAPPNVQRRQYLR